MQHTAPHTCRINTSTKLQGDIAILYCMYACGAAVTDGNGRIIIVVKIGIGLGLRLGLGTGT